MISKLIEKHEIEKYYQINFDSISWYNIKNINICKYGLGWVDFEHFYLRPKRERAHDLYKKNPHHFLLLL